MTRTATSQRTRSTKAKRAAPAKSAKSSEVQAVLAALKRHATPRILNGYPRYGIVVTKAFGVPMGSIQKVAKTFGRDHGLAAALWETGWYEARLVAAFMDEPDRVTPAQMDKWCRDFDNWGVCDTICFHLFDRTPHAFRKVAQWAKRSDEFQRRAAFALL